ncbi:MAG: biopolymer transporter ExbD [Chitinivibrionales bacterium]|nr:biopolymer transporter ExbD [Chitinivibrionales bacterium]
MAKSRGRSKANIGIAEGVNITSMMDILTILLLYLIVNYSAEGNILTNADNLTLPNSSAKKKANEVVLQIAVDNSMIVVDNKAVVSVEEVRKIGQNSLDQTIPALKNVLEAKFAQEEAAVKIGLSNKVEGKVIIQIDKNMDFDVMYKVMTTCGTVGYRTMLFAVMERGDPNTEGAEFKLFPVKKG